MPPIYHLFMENSYSISNRVCLITPARFLFNTGFTPTAWNNKMLNDDHFKVLYYESKSDVIFPNTDIKGGVIISYRDITKKYDPIVIFTKFDELNGILKKVKNKSNNFMSEIISSNLSYGLTDKMIHDYPELIGRLRTNAFKVLSDIFFEEKPNDGNDYIVMYGLFQSRRVRRYVRRDYILDKSGTLNKFKVLFPSVSGNGQFGEQLTSSIIAEPETGYTQTFIAIGRFNTKQEAENSDKYIKTKLARAMLGVLKTTQHCPGPRWAYVPLQDFTSNSDIDWSKSVAEIDLQLYAKYGLDEAEIEFIESHVKEMS